MKTYKLGEKITVLHRLERQKVDKHYNWTVRMFDGPRVATVVGVRTLADGYMDKFGRFTGTRHKRALLVAENLRGMYYVLL
jgi:hypothetical protein